MNQSDITWDVYESPIGPLTLIAGPAGLRGLWFPGKTPAPPESARAPLPAVTEQLDAYFAGELRAFEVDLDMRGPAARPRGLAPPPRHPLREDRELRGARRPRRSRRSSAPASKPWQRARAVGAANGRNPVSIIVPCHRVIGADGSLTGYGGGLHRKQALLELEGSGRPDPAWATRQTSLL